MMFRISSAIPYSIMLALSLFCFTGARAFAIASSDSQASGNSIPAVVQVVVDEKAPPISIFDGLGTELDPYEDGPSPERWWAILSRMDYARFGLIRVMSSAYDYCDGFDAKGNPIYVWDTHNPKTQKHLDRLFTILDYAQSRGISVYLGEWGHPAHFGLHTPDDPRWQRLITDFVDYLINKKHYTVIGHYIMMNEPNGSWSWHEGPPMYGQWARGIRQLRKDFDARGLSSVQISGPDNAGGEDWFADSVHDLAPQFGAWESHLYPKDEAVFNDAVEKDLNHDRVEILKHDRAGADKPRILGEVGGASGKDGLHGNRDVPTYSYGVLMADITTEIIRAGWTGASAWMLDDALHIDQNGKLHSWGFWDSSSKSGFTIRPWFYTWSLMSRYFPKGAKILKVDSTPPVARFRATSAEWADADGLEGSILLVNDDDAALTVTIAAPVFAAKKFYCYHYFNSDRPVDQQGLPVPAGTGHFPVANQKITIKMPSRGVVLLTTGVQ
jgi:hypothetical protein